MRGFLPALSMVRLPHRKPHLQPHQLARDGELMGSGARGDPRNFSRHDPGPSRHPACRGHARFGSDAGSIFVMGAGRNVISCGFFSSTSCGFFSSTGAGAAAGAGASFTLPFGTNFRTLVSLMVFVGQASLPVSLCFILRGARVQAVKAGGVPVLLKTLPAPTDILQPLKDDRAPRPH